MPFLLPRRAAALARATVTAASRGLAWILLPPLYLAFFVPLRLWRLARGARDPLGTSFPGPAGTLWRERDAPGDADRMH